MVKMVIDSNKQLLFNTDFDLLEVRVAYSLYNCNQSLAVLMLRQTSDNGEIYMPITVNLFSSQRYNTKLQYVNVNQSPLLERWLQENDIAYPTGKKCKSGWLTYPEYSFNIDEQILLYLSNIF